MISKLRIPGLRLILAIILGIIVSWLLVHSLAIFGVLLAIAYPIWWFLTPAKVPCLFCRTQKENRPCISCRQKVGKIESRSPKTFFSMSLNTILILVISLVCMAFVFGESKFLFKLGFPLIPKTASFVIPAKGQYRLGEIFPMKIEIAGIETPINAVQADLGFDPQKLEVVDISTEDSFANIFIQKEVDNEVGYARLTGGLPSPGFFSDRGVFGTVFFKGRSPGIVEIEFLPSSMVLANDSRGTNILKDLASVSYLILPEKVSKEEEMQKGASMKSAVLGKTSKDTQMKFYEEDRILGTQVGQEIQEEIKFSITKVILGGLEKIDRFILSLWEKVLRAGIDFDK